LHIFDLAKNPGVIKIKEDNVAIQRGSHKLIHVVNLQYLDIMITQVEKLFDKLGDNNPFRSTLDAKMNDLQTALNNLTPKSRKKRAWEDLGSGIKWLAGNADADDLRDIQHNFQLIEKKQNELIENNNRQNDINDVFEDRINKISKLIAVNIDNALNKTFDNFEFVNLLFNIDIIRAKIETFINAIVHSKSNIAVSNLLSKEELELISKKLIEQNLTFNSLSEILSYLTPTVKYTQQIFQYAVIIPKVEDGFEKFTLHPFTREGKIMQLESRQALKKEQVTFELQGQCLKTPIPICQQHQIREISNDECIPPLLRDEAANCLFKEKKQIPSITSINDETLLVENFINPAKFESNCGMPPHPIIGSLLIVLKNCTIKVNGSTYENTQTSSTTNFEILPVLEEVRQRNKELLINTEDLHELHIKHRDELKALKLKRLEEKQNINYIFMAIVATLVIIIFGTAAIIWRSYLPTIPAITNFEDKVESSAEELQPQPTMRRSIFA
jgi:Gypsy protein